LKKLTIVLSAIALAQTTGVVNAGMGDVHVNDLKVDQHGSLQNLILADTKTYLEEEEEEAGNDENNGQIFGSRHGRFHASVGLNGEWTDNLYNTDTDKQENFLTTFDGDVWFTYPERSMKAFTIINHNTSTGGLQWTPVDNRYFNTYQINIGGAFNYKMYSENSDLDMLAGSVKGMFQYNPSTSLTLQLADSYSLDQDQFDISNATEDNQRIYGSNVFMASIDWQIVEKFSAIAKYTNFALAYDDSINEFLDRSDNGFDIAAYYDYSPKTNFFLEYRTLIASYDDDFDGINRENNNNFIYAGVNWHSTVKTTLMAKVGYQMVDYDSDEYEDEDNFTGELQWNWFATVKSNMIVDAVYSVEQSDSQLAINKTVFTGRVGFYHRFTNRLRGNLDLIYENSDYEQLIEYDRTDDRYYIKPEVQYAVWKWLSINAYYMYESKDSNQDFLDYDTNIFGIGLKGTL
jgi:hypothetical protein